MAVDLQNYFLSDLPRPYSLPPPQKIRNSADQLGGPRTEIRYEKPSYWVVAGGGWNAGYGNHVIVDHGNGFVTLYAHLNSIFVRPGENISRGQQIGTVGNTGNSTGPHLHFEIRYHGVPQNPFGYLP